MNQTTEKYLFKNELAEAQELPVITFKTGETVFIDKAAAELKLFDKNQHLQLVISMRENGLEININASHLNINATEELNLSGKKINIEATDQLNIKTAGNLVQQIEKDALTEVGGVNKMLATVQKITATLGDVMIKANDDIKLNGERVKLNCD